MIDMPTCLRVACGSANTETEASDIVFRTLSRSSHPDAPPSILSAGWGGIDEAMIEVYGQVPGNSGRGQPPTRKQPLPSWQYLQVVKQHENGRVVGTALRSIYGD